MNKLAGIITPIVTPFSDEAGQPLCFQALEKHIEHLIDHGVAGIFVLGSNGEFHVLRHDEKISLIAKAAEIIHGRVPLFAGTGSCSTQESIDLSVEAEKAGADVLSILPPYFFQPSEEELFQHYTRIAERVSLPIILYNIPKTVGYTLSPTLVTRLAEHPSIVGIKDSSGKLELIDAYAEIANSHDFSLLIGSDSKISYAHAKGAVGAIAGTSNLITDILVSLWKALEEKDARKAAHLQEEIDVLRAVMKRGTVPSILKRSIERANIAPVGPARFPVQKPSLKVEEEIDQMLRHYHLL